MLAAARELGGSISARSAEIEALGTLPMDLVDEIRPTGAFRQCVPDDLGGPGVTAAESLEVFEELAYHDGSVGWCVAIASTTSLLASYLPDPHAGALFGDPGAIGGGFVVPRGRAVPVEGGLRVSGRWQWGSGTKHCTTIGGGCLVVGPGERPEPRGDGLAAPFVFMDPDDIGFIETWDVAGLAGTGSVDFEAQDVFVPEGCWVQIGTGGPVRDNAWSRFSFYGLLASGGGGRGGGNRPPRHRRAGGAGRVEEAPGQHPDPGRAARDAGRDGAGGGAAGSGMVADARRGGRYLAGRAGGTAVHGRPEAADPPRSHPRHPDRGRCGRVDVHDRGRGRGVPHKPDPALLPRHRGGGPARHGGAAHPGDRRPPAHGPPNRHHHPVTTPTMMVLDGVVVDGVVLDVVAVGAVAKVVIAVDVIAVNRK